MKKHTELITNSFGSTELFFLASLKLVSFFFLCFMAHKFHSHQPCFQQPAAVSDDSSAPQQAQNQAVERQKLITCW